MKFSKSYINTAIKFNNQTLLLNDSASHTVFGSYLLKYQNRMAKPTLMNSYLLNYRVNNSKPDFGFSLGTFMSPQARASLVTAPLEEHTSSDVISLKKTNNYPKGSLISATLNRRSHRKFKAESLSLEDLAAILQFSMSASEKIETNRVYSRPYPSGGGMYSVYLYLLIKNVEGISKGIYKYQPYSHSLYLVNTKINSDLNYYCNMSGIDIENVNVVGFWTYEERKNSLKYGEMSFPLALIEYGHAMQTLDLLSYFYGLGTCQLGGFEKRTIEKSLKIDGINTHAIGCFVMGKVL